MAWVYLPGSEDSNWVCTERGCAALHALSSSTSTLSKSSQNDSQTCPYGTMSEPSTDSRDSLISSREDFLARISAWRGRVRASQESDQVFGRNSTELSAKYDPHSHSLRTSQCSLFGEELESLQTLPKSGMMLNGALYQLRMSSGLEAIRNHPPFITAENASSLLRLPTPTICGDCNRKGASKTSGDGLRTVVMRLPTPNAGDLKAGFSNAPDRSQSSLPRSVAYLEGKSSGKRGGVNPNWKEWLMGFPIGWSDLNVSATQLCHSAQST